MIETWITRHRDGDRQTIRLPDGFALPGDEAILRREDDRLTVEPVRRSSLLATLSQRDPLDVAWPEIEDPSPEPIEL